MASTSPEPRRRTGSDIPYRDPDLRFTPPTEPGAPAVISTPEGRVFEVSEAAARLLQLVDGERDRLALAAEYARVGGTAVDPDTVERILGERFEPLGLVAYGEPPSPRSPASRLWLRIPLLPAVAARFLAGLAAPLARPRALLALGIPALLLNGWYLSRPGVLQEALEQPQLVSVATLLVILSLAWHELGHAAALRAQGLNPGAIGIGMYRFVPVWFTDVSLARHLPRGGRVLVDAAGMLFQLLAAGVFAAVGLWLRPDPEWARAVLVINGLVLLNLNPFLRFDGYWIVEDLTGVRDLRGGTRDVLGRLLGRGDGPRSRWLVLYGWASLVYFVALLAVLSVQGVPRILSRVDEALGGDASLLERGLVLGGSFILLLGLAVLALVVARNVRLAYAGPGRGGRRVIPAGGRLLSTLREPWNLSRAWMRLQLARSEREHILRLVSVSLSTAFSETRSPSELRGLARNVFIEIQRGRFANDDLGRGARAHRVDGARHLERLAEAGSGCILMSLHQGPFHYVATEAAHITDGVSVFAASHLKKHFEAFWAGIGVTHDIRLTILGATEPTSLLRAVRTLRGGERVVIFADVGNRVGGRVGGEHAVVVQFLKLSLSVSLGPAFMAQKAGVPLVPSIARRERGMRRVVSFGEPIRVGPGREGLESATRAVYALFEAEVAERPEQWDGWLTHLLLWGDPVPPPMAGRDAWRESSAALEREMREGSRRRLVVEPTHVAWLGDTEERLVVHGPPRRLLKGSPLTCRVLDAGVAGVPLGRLAREVDGDSATVAREVARIVLAGLGTIE